MEKYSNEELLEVLPTNVRESKELTTKQKVVLGQLIIYSGLDKKDNEGYFFRSNKDLTNDCDIQEKTLIAAVNKLVMLGFIDTVRGTKKNNRASLYRINQKTIDDYCKTIVDDYSKRENENYSNDYSEIITAMHVRITELEITVKNLVERITVIEGRNYSTDTDKDIELDKEKELLNNNILNNTSFNNILGETESNQELETIDSDNNKLNQSQLVSIESEDSKLNQSQLESNEIPAEVLISTNELDSLNDHTDEPSTLSEETNTDEETYVPTAEEKEAHKQCTLIVNHYLTKLQAATSEMLFYSIKDDMKKAVQKYIDTSDSVSDWVVDEINTRLKAYFDAKSREFKEKHQEEINRQLRLNSQYAAFY